MSIGEFAEKELLLRFDALCVGQQLVLQAQQRPCHFCSTHMQQLLPLLWPNSSEGIIQHKPNSCSTEMNRREQGSKGSPNLPCCCCCSPRKFNSPLKKFDLPEPLAPTAHAKQQQLFQRVLLASSGAAPCSPQAGSLTHYVDLWTEGVCNELVLVAQETLDDDLQVILKSLFRLSAKQPGWWRGPHPPVCSAAAAEVAVWQASAPA